MRRVKHNPDGAAFALCKNGCDKDQIGIPNGRADRAQISAAHDLAGRTFTVIGQTITIGIPAQIATGQNICLKRHIIQCRNTMRKPRCRKGNGQHDKKKHLPEYGRGHADHPIDMHQLHLADNTIRARRDRPSEILLVVQGGAEGTAKCKTARPLAASDWRTLPSRRHLYQGVDTATAPSRPTDGL